MNHLGQQCPYDDGPATCQEGECPDCQIWIELRQQAPLETFIEIDVRFPPKKTRPLMGKLIRKEVSCNKRLA